MGKGRLEAFSDGVFAIIITIMVLELRVPHGGDEAAGVGALIPLVPVFGSYVLSFVFIAISVPLAFVDRRLSLALYIIVAAMWPIPDRRIERTVAAPSSEHHP